MNKVKTPIHPYSTVFNSFWSFEHFMYFELLLNINSEIIRTGIYRESYKITFLYKSRLLLISNLYCISIIGRWLLFKCIYAFTTVVWRLIIILSGSVRIRRFWRS